MGRIVRGDSPVKPSPSKSLKIYEPPDSKSHELPVALTSWSQVFPSEGGGTVKKHLDRWHSFQLLNRGIFCRWIQRRICPKVKEQNSAWPNFFCSKSWWNMCSKFRLFVNPGSHPFAIIINLPRFVSHAEASHWIALTSIWSNTTIREIYRPGLKPKLVNKPNRYVHL